MEKQIKVIARYHYEHEYFVEVSHEDSFTAGRDYWLCKRGSTRKLFMFSSPYKDARTEERMILRAIPSCIERYEGAENIRTA
ncbi:MAG: hypothetical protein LUC32_04010 [Clostridiales bacterium]|nr:hypothetical protein [Clostridiales bacterium]